jgi:murein DD-endopeptidase MepM/ murein hydrolase activator NlpD
VALSSDQLNNARIIIQVGRQLGASQRDILIALMTAMQESGLRSGLTEARSDRDSAGLFQQRRAWAPGGSQSYRLNPYNAARMFFQGGHGGQRGLFAFKNRNNMSLTRAAQAVQVSAYPNAYAKHESVARGLLGLRGAPSTKGGGGGGEGASGGFVRPVSGGRITQNFGDPPPRGATYARGFKNGMSFAAPAGSPVYASANGKVVRVASGGAYGKRIEIAHGGRIWTLYAHLSATNVAVGQEIRAGQQIGRVGATGQAFGAHLHFELRKGENGYYSAVDPRKYLNMNTTPSAYMQDINSTYTQTVPGQMDEFLDQPMQDQALNRPYVYVDPFAALTIQSQDTPGVMDPFGAIIDQQNVPSGSDLLPETEDDTVPEPVLAEEPEVI